MAGESSAVTELKTIVNLFHQIASSLEVLHEQHHAAGNLDDRDSVARQLELNQQAYFMLA